MPDSADILVARFFHDTGAGLVVDSSDPAALRTALDRLRTDEELRRRLVARALEAARGFEAGRIAAQLRAELQEVARR